MSILESIFRQLYKYNIFHDYQINDKNEEKKFVVELKDKENETT